MWFYRARVAAMCGGDEDCAAGVSSLTDEEPLVVVKARINIMQEVVREDGGDSCDSVVWEGEASLHCSGGGSVHERATSVEDRDVSHDWGSGIHWGSEVLVLWGGNENVVGVNSNVLVKQGKKKGVEDFLGYPRGSGRHR